MATYIVRQAFQTFTVGQVVYSDGDAAGKPAGSVITDAQVGGHGAALVSVSNSTPPTSTTGTSTGGTGSGTGGTGSGGTGGGTSAPLVYVVSDTPNADGSITFLDSSGVTHTSAPGLTATQTTSLAAVPAIKAEADASAAADISQAASLTALGGSLTTLGSQVGTLASQVAGFSSQSGAAVATTGTPAMDGVAALGSATTAARSDHVHASDTSRAAVSALTALAGTVTSQGTSLTAVTGTANANTTAVSTQGSLLATTRAAALVTPAISNGALTFGHADGSTGITLTLPVSSGGTGSAITIPNAALIGGNGSTLSGVALGAGLAVTGGTLSATGTAAASGLISAVSSDFLVTSGTLGLAQDVLGLGSSSGGTATSTPATAATFLTTSYLYGALSGNVVLGTGPTAMTQIPFGANSDGGSNGQSGGYVCGSVGTYEMEAVLLLAAPNTSGLTTAPAGTRCGFQLLNDGGGEVTQYAYTQPKEATARVLFVLPITSLPYTIKLWGFADAAHTVVTGPAGLSSFVAIRRVF